MKKVFIIESRPANQRALVRAIKAEEGLAVCGCADSTRDALECLSKLKPHVMVVESGLSEKAELQLVKKIRTASRTVKLLVISGRNDMRNAASVMLAGGDGYVLKDEHTEEIVQAIRDLLNGHIYVSEEIFENQPPRKASKSRRAKSLSHSLQTFSNHRRDTHEAVLAC